MVSVSVYEPTFDDHAFFGSKVTHNPESFKESYDAIIANRWSEELSDAEDKVFTRDLFEWD